LRPEPRQLEALDVPGLRGIRIGAQAFASSRSFSGGTTASMMPAANASAGFSRFPSSKSGAAAAMPISRGRRCVPPPPGISPSVTSGKPKRADGTSAAILR
jgi:hypothetical protein